MKIIKNLMIFAFFVFVGLVSFAQEKSIDAEIKKIILGRWSVNNNNMCKIVDKSAGVYFADDNGYINRENFNIDKNLQSIKSKISLKISQIKKLSNGDLQFVGVISEEDKKNSYESVFEYDALLQNTLKTKSLNMNGKKIVENGINVETQKQYPILYKCDVDVSQNIDKTSTTNSANNDAQKDTKSDQLGIAQQQSNQNSNIPLVEIQLTVKIPKQSTEKCNIDVAYPDGSTAQYDIGAPDYSTTIKFTPLNFGSNKVSWQGKLRLKGFSSLNGCEGNGIFTVLVNNLDRKITASIKEDEPLKTNDTNQGEVTTKNKPVITLTSMRSVHRNVTNVCSKKFEQFQEINNRARMLFNNSVDRFSFRGDSFYSMLNGTDSKFYIINNKEIIALKTDLTKVLKDNTSANSLLGECLGSLSELVNLTVAYNKDKLIERSGVKLTSDQFCAVYENNQGVSQYVSSLRKLIRFFDTPQGDAFITALAKGTMLDNNLQAPFGYSKSKFEEVVKSRVKLEFLSGFVPSDERNAKRISDLSPFSQWNIENTLKYFETKVDYTNPSAMKDIVDSTTKFRNFSEVANEYGKDCITKWKVQNPELLLAFMHPNINNSNPESILFWSSVYTSEGFDYFIKTGEMKGRGNFPPQLVEVHNSCNINLYKKDSNGQTLTREEKLNYMIKNTNNCNWSMVSPFYAGAAEKFNIQGKFMSDLYEELIQKSNSVTAVISTEISKQEQARINEQRKNPQNCSEYLNLMNLTVSESGLTAKAIPSGKILKVYGLLTEFNGKTSGSIQGSETINGKEIQVSKGAFFNVTNTTKWYVKPEQLSLGATQVQIFGNYVSNQKQNYTNTFGRVETVTNPVVNSICIEQGSGAMGRFLDDMKNLDSIINR